LLRRGRHYCCVARTVTGCCGSSPAIGGSPTENRRLVQAEQLRLRQGITKRAAARQQYDPRKCARRRRGSDAPNGGVDGCLAKSATRHAEIQLELPTILVDHYREILRAYVIMGTGNLGEEMSALAHLLAGSNISAQRTMQLHVQVLEELVEGLGNRSARHVMNRADLLALEVLGHLADGYRARFHERRHPPQQQLLPGFEPAPDGGPVFFRVAA
jgi:hypothetical protein